MVPAFLNLPPTNINHSTISEPSIFSSFWRIREAPPNIPNLLEGLMALTPAVNLKSKFRIYMVPKSLQNELVGWTNPSEKYAQVKLGSSSPNWDENNK